MIFFFSKLGSVHLQGYMCDLFFTNLIEIGDVMK
jgi:hypothetical protein